MVRTLRLSLAGRPNLPFILNRFSDNIQQAQKLYRELVLYLIRKYTALKIIKGNELML